MAPPHLFLPIHCHLLLNLIWIVVLVLVRLITRPAVQVSCLIDRFAVAIGAKAAGELRILPERVGSAMSQALCMSRVVRKS
jgi:hypothetical protein